MLDSGFFMAMGGLGVSLAGFAGLFSALHQQDDRTDPAVYRWRIREIVTSSFRLAFLAFGVIVVFGITDDIAWTARIISALAALGGIVSIFGSMRPGPAWPDEVDRTWAIRASWVWVAVVAGNVLVGSQNYLRGVMLVLLLSPALVFIRATIDATGEPAPDGDRA